MLSLTATVWMGLCVGITISNIRTCLQRCSNINGFSLRRQLRNEPEDERGSLRKAHDAAIGFELDLP